MNRVHLSVDVGVGGVGLDEVAAGCNVFAHEHGEDTVGFGGVADMHLFEDSVFGRHGGHAQLFIAHLAETFIALYLSAFAIFCHELLHLLVVPAILLVLTHLAFIQWG